MFEIRCMTEGDDAAVMALWRVCGLLRPADDPVAMVAAKRRQDADGLLVAVGDAGLCGSIMFGYEGRRGWLNLLAVDPACRHQGIGRALVRAAEAALKVQGCPKVNLQIRQGNAAVVAFYRRLGYEIDEVISMGHRLT